MCRYEGVVAAISTAGNFIVHFEGYGTQEEVDRANVRQAPSNTEGDGSGYKGEPPAAPAAMWHVHPHFHVLVLQSATALPSAAGVAAPKRRHIDEEAAGHDMPAWLEIRPTGEACLYTLQHTLSVLA